MSKFGLDLCCVPVEECFAISFSKVMTSFFGKVLVLYKAILYPAKSARHSLCFCRIVKNKKASCRVRTYVNELDYTSIPLFRKAFGPLSNALSPYCNSAILLRICQIAKTRNQERSVKSGWGGVDCVVILSAKKILTSFATTLSICHFRAIVLRICQIAKNLKLLHPIHHADRELDHAAIRSIRKKYSPFADTLSSYRNSAIALRFCRIVKNIKESTLSSKGEYILLLLSGGTVPQKLSYYINGFAPVPNYKYILLCFCRMVKNKKTGCLIKNGWGGVVCVVILSARKILTSFATTLSICYFRALLLRFCPMVKNLKLSHHTYHAGRELGYTAISTISKKYYPLADTLSSYRNSAISLRICQIIKNKKPDHFIRRNGEGSVDIPVIPSIRILCSSLVNILSPYHFSIPSLQFCPIVKTKRPVSSIKSGSKELGNTAISTIGKAYKAISNIPLPHCVTIPSLQFCSIVKNKEAGRCIRSRSKEFDNTVIYSIKKLCSSLANTHSPNHFRSLPLRFCQIVKNTKIEKNKLSIKNKDMAQVAGLIVNSLFQNLNCKESI